MLDAMLGRTGRKSLVKKKGRLDKMAAWLASTFVIQAFLMQSFERCDNALRVEAMTMTIATDCFSKLRMRIGEYAYFL